ncbi:YSIRK-type signal peptide-containing protein, partial [Campylobacter jejuni]|nr:YSIRK-type signal peptide-containing protein [Campylobacter jejuni]
NVHELMLKMVPQRQRFTLRKLSVGVVSVLVGASFLLGGNVEANADTNAVSASKMEQTGETTSENIGNSADNTVSLKRKDTSIADDPVKSDAAEVVSETTTKSPEASKVENTVEDTKNKQTEKLNVSFYDQDLGTTVKDFSTTNVNATSDLKNIYRSLLDRGYIVTDDPLN